MAVQTPVRKSPTMQLPVAIINDISDMLQGVTGPSRLGDRRVCPRLPMHKCMAVVPYLPGQAGAPVQVWVSDISAGGVGLIFSAEMQLDEQFIIRLPLPDDDELPMLCTVVRCARMGQNLYAIGSRFVQPFCGNDLEL